MTYYLDKRLKKTELANSERLKNLEFENNEKIQNLNQEHQQKLADTNNRFQAELEVLKKRLESKKSEEDARRDYQYEALKRLYAEFEPLLFQFNELSDSAFKRIVALARESKSGKLTSWLSSTDGYYFKSSIYRLLSPLAVFRLMQSQLTLFDLNLEFCIKVQYSLIKALYHTFAHDFKLAESIPEIRYRPYDITDYEIASKSGMLQGIFIGVVDQLVDIFKEDLINENSQKKSRIITYGEFENKYSALKNSGKLDPIIQLLSDFHPRTKPVLWRILLTQAHIYKAIMTLNRRAMSSCENIKPLKIMSRQERESLFDWRRPGDDIAEDEVFEKPFAAVEYYLDHNTYVEELLEKSVSD